LRAPCNQRSGTEASAAEFIYAKIGKNEQKSTQSDAKMKRNGEKMSENDAKTVRKRCEKENGSKRQKKKKKKKKIEASHDRLIFQNKSIARHRFFVLFCFVLFFGVIYRKKKEKKRDKR
jgi:hypothetical protein